MTPDDTEPQHDPAADPSGGPAQAAGAAGDGAGSGPGTGRGPRARLLATGAVVAVLGLLGLYFATRAEDPAPTPTTTTTTTTTTTEPAARAATVSQVATAKPGVELVKVWSEPPAGWETMEPVVSWEAPELPASQAEFTDRPDLPREDYPIEGRYRNPTGWEFSNPTAFDNPFAMLVTEQRGNWAEVMLPVRPNGTVGYVDTSQVDMSEHDYRVELDLSDRQLTVYRGSEVITDTKVVVGKDSTRTPTGRFYVTDKLDETPSAFYGPHLLALNSYSEQLDIFDDGVPIIALHGTTRPDQVGQAVSNGCVRLPNEIITQLDAELPLGTQVEIVA
jgi:hypothetical protein